MSRNNRIQLALDAGQFELPNAKRAFIFNADPFADYSAFENIQALQFSYPSVEAVKAQGFETVLKPEGESSIVVIELPRSKQEAKGLVGLALNHLKEDGMLLINGDKTNGVESILKALRKEFDVDGVFSKSHGKVIWMSPNPKPKNVLSWHADLASRPNADGYQTCAGIFSEGKIDKGSALLFDYLPKTISGNGADLGAGWGYLSKNLLDKCEGVQSIELVESDYRALDCAKANVADARAIFTWGDAREYSNRNLDFVVMNPPFHQTRKAEPSLGQSFIQAAASSLSNKGSLWLVANRQLAYEGILDDLFKRVETIALTPQYKVINAYLKRKN